MVLRKKYYMYIFQEKCLSRRVHSWRWIFKAEKKCFFFVFVSRIIHSNFSQSCLVHVNEDIRRIQSTCTSYILSHVVCYGYHSCWSSQVGSIPYVERSNQNPYLQYRKITWGEWNLTLIKDMSFKSAHYFLAYPFFDYFFETF